MLLNFYKKLGPLGPSFLLFTAFIIIFALNRIGLGLYFSDNLTISKDYLFYLPVGIRMDTIVLSLFFSLPVLITLLTPPQLFNYIRPVLVLFFLLTGIFFIFMEIASWPFLEQYSSRPNQLFFQYFTHPKEVLLMVWAEYKFLLISTFIFLYYFVKYYWKALTQLFSTFSPWPYWKNLVALPFCILLLTLGARSGIGQANANPSLAAFSNNHFANQLALNASYSLSYSIYSSLKPSISAEKLFGDMPKEEIVKRVKKYMDVESEAFISNKIPTLHVQKPNQTRQPPLNLVVIIMEGLGSDYIGTLGGYDVTPNFDKLAEQGLLFTNIHSIGTRTSRGIEAMVSGFLPTPKSSSILKLDLAQHNFFTIASLLKKHQYNTNFIYGGEAHFDNMAGFFLGNGFDEIIDEADFENPDFYGTWGVSDEDIFRKANEIFRHKSEPFLSVILTISNHPPYDYPEGRIQLVEQPANTPKNSTKYSDYALGQFFEAAKKEAYFENTVFLITGDHPMLIRADSLVPVEKYKIPALIIAPDIHPKRINTLGSQMDLLPTALSLLGMETIHPMIGQNLTNESSTVPRRQVSIYSQSIAFKTKDKVAIYQPHKKPKTFVLDTNGELQATEDDVELEKDALAHILFPGLVYREQIYGLP